MKVREKITLAFIFVVIFCFSAIAERPLESQEVLQIINDLTSQPSDMWIPHGTVKIRHEEYKAPKTINESEIRQKIKEQISKYQTNPNKVEKSEDVQKMKLDAIPFNVRYNISNESTMITEETVCFDDQRYCWDVNIISRTDSVKPGKKLEGNFMKEDFPLNYNAKKMYVWDGEKYTIFSPLANHAFIDTANFMPHDMPGPIKTFLIPWGFGYYSYDNLETLNISGLEKLVDGKTQIMLSINNSNGSQIIFELDPDKNYSVLSCSKTGCSGFQTSTKYSEYCYINDTWIPMLITRVKSEGNSNKLLERDSWQITDIVLNMPDAEAFDVDLPDGTVVEYLSPVSPKPLSYHYLQNGRTDALLVEKLVFDSKKSTMKQNCATAAVEHVAKKFNNQIDENELEALVTEPNNTTSLYQMKEYLQDLGLYCRAIKTDLETLQSLNNYEIILHLPAKNHFVVIDSITEENVNIIDLASRKFYYQIDTAYFQMDWPTGIALLVSNQPIQGQFQDVSSTEIQGIEGTSGYNCNTLIQEEDDLLCFPAEAPCGGTYTHWYERWGCGSASNGSCTNDRLLRMSRCICIEDPYDFFVCIGNEYWINYYMYACD